MKNGLGTGIFSLFAFVIAVQPAFAESASKLFTIELANTLPGQTHLITLFGSDLQYAYGLTERLQVEFGHSGLSLAPAYRLPLRAQVKSLLWQGETIGIGSGLALSSSFSKSGASFSTAKVFAPITFSGFPGLAISFVPSLSTGGKTVFALGTGLAYMLGGAWVLIAEDNLSDLGRLRENTVLLGGAYLGLRPGTTLALGIAAGNGIASVFEAIKLGF